MAADVFPERVVWQRAGGGRRFVGTLSRSGGRLRLAGHDPLGAEALLLLPCAGLGISRVASCPEEWLGEAPALVLPLAGAGPLLLRPVAPDGPVDLAELQRFLDDAVRRSDVPEMLLRRMPASSRRPPRAFAEKAARP